MAAKSFLKQGHESAVGEGSARQEGHNENLEHLGERVLGDSRCDDGGLHTSADS